MISRIQPLLFTLLFWSSVLFPETVGTLLLTNNPMRDQAGDLIILDLKSGRMDTLVKATDSMVPYGPCFSPDGRKVAFTTKDHYKRVRKRIRIIDLFSRVITGIGPDSLMGEMPLSWAGKHIFCTYGWSTSLPRVNVETGIVDTIFTFKALFDQNYWTKTGYDPGIWGQGNVSRDGTRGAYVLTRASNNVFSFDASIPSEVNHSMGGAACQAAMSPNGEWVASTNHKVNRIQRCHDSVEVQYEIYGYNFWFNRWSYNSDNDLTFCNMDDTAFYRYRLDTQKSEFLIKGFCVWNWDTRGWVLDTLAPSAPFGLTATCTDNTINLRWTAPTSGTPPTGYVIERNGIRVGTSATTTFVDSHLTATTAYDYSVYGRTNGVALSAPLSGTFSTTVDRVPPRLIGAYAYATTIDLIFSEPLNAASVTTVSNYAITPSLAVSSAVLVAPKRVRLSTGNTNNLTGAVIRVSGVKDVALNAAADETDSISIVSNLWVSTGRACGWAAIDSGTPYWTDDDNPPASMPKKSLQYGDLPFLQTSTRDGTVSADSNYLKFTLNRRMMVMVIGGAPWCTEADGWTATGDNIGGWTGDIIKGWPVSTKVFGPGPVTLKGRGYTRTFSTYIVAFKNWDSSLNVADEGPRLTPTAGAILTLSPSPASGGRSNIVYQLSTAGHVRLAIYNTQGKRINTIVDKKQSIGNYRITWTGVDSHKQPLSNGVYFCALTIDHRMVKIERLVVVQ